MGNIKRRKNPKWQDELKKVYFIDWVAGNQHKNAQPSTKMDYLSS